MAAAPGRQTNSTGKEEKVQLFYLVIASGLLFPARQLACSLERNSHAARTFKLHIPLELQHDLPEKYQLGKIFLILRPEKLNPFPCL
jgi:hypothetical protein